MVGAWCFSCLSGPLGFTGWISFAPYSVLFTVALLYLLVISWFKCSGRWCIDKLGVFHANQISMCLDPHLNWGWGWRRETGLSPSVKYITVRSKVQLLLWICALWSPAGKGLTSWLSFMASNCEFVTFPLVSWVRCGTWLYWFLIFAPLLTLTTCRLIPSIFFHKSHWPHFCFYIFGLWSDLESYGCSVGSKYWYLLLEFIPLFATRVLVIVSIDSYITFQLIFVQM